MTGAPPLTAPPEVQIAWTITCLRENNWYGCYEILGTAGFVVIRRDGQIDTRVDGAVEQHRTTEDAALRLALAENSEERR